MRRLRRQVELSPPPMLPALPDEAIGLTDSICWAALDYGDGRCFHSCAWAAVALGDFLDCAWLSSRR